MTRSGATTLCCLALLGLVAASPASAKKHCPNGQILRRRTCMRKLAVPSQVPAVAPLQAIVDAASRLPGKGHHRIPAERLRAGLAHVKGLNARGTGLDPDPR